MATIKVNGTSYFISSSKITTPSIKINGQGYIPLFSGNKNSTVDYNRYRYTLGELKVGGYRAAVSRSFINSAPTATLSASATRVANGTNVTLTTTAADPDGDTLTNFCYYTKVNGVWDSGGNSGTSITVSGSNTTKEYYVVVTDPYGASVTSNHVTVEWFEPNHTPVIRLSNVPSSSSNGNISFTIEYGDVDYDNCTIKYGFKQLYYDIISTYITGTITVATRGEFGSGQSVNVTVSNAYKFNEGYYILYAEINDGLAHADTYAYVTHVNTPTYAYKCTVECWKEEHEREGYSIAPITWNVKVTANRYPSSCEGICLFANNGDGTGWIYKSEQIEFCRDSQPSTVQLVPYVTFNNTINETERVWVGYGVSGNANGWKETIVSKTIQDRKSAGTNKSVAVSFPGSIGYANRITTTYEWN